MAEDEARRRKRDFVGTEHILLGVLRENEGLGATALGLLGVTLEAVHEKVEEAIGPAGTDPPDPPAMTPRAKKVLELSLKEALHLGRKHVGTEHLLLGIVREGEGLASQVLVSLGLQLSGVRQIVVQLINGVTPDARPLPPFGRVEVVRPGWSPADYAGAYEELARLVGRPDTLTAAEVTVISEGTGLRLVAWRD
jgi:ATP-dependent Clp protease ATP-binding subunit ClpC